MEILEQGREPERPPGPRGQALRRASVAATGVAAAGALVVGALAFLSPSPPAASGPSAGRPTASADLPRNGPMREAAPPRPLAGATRSPRSTLLVLGERSALLPLTGASPTSAPGDPTPLAPLRPPRAIPGAGVAVGDGFVVVTAPRGARPRAVVVSSAGRLRDLGDAVAVWRAWPEGVWLQAERPGRRTIRAVDLTGRVLVPERPLPPGARPAGATLAGVVLGPLWPALPGPVTVWDPRTGRTTAVTGAGAVHDTDATAVVYSPCAGACGLRLWSPELGGSAAMAVPAQGRLAGRLRLAPDRRHWAVALRGTREPEAPTTVIIGHRPATARSDRFVEVLRLPGAAGGSQLTYASSGWLMASTGTLAYAISPGPHEAYVVPGLPAHDRLLAS